jgi:hypothetical protein
VSGRGTRLLCGAVSRIAAIGLLMLGWSLKVMLA